MQYVLTEDEMAAQQRNNDTLARLPSVDDLQKFCTMVSDSLILTEGWAKGRVWGCILTVGKRNYCDDCPAKDVCPYPYKNWSK